MKLLLCIIVSFLVSIIIHELGHAFFAILVRSKVTGINIGVGPKIWSNTFLCIRLFPIAGNLECELDVSNKKGIVKMIFIAMGGCVFNGVLFLICINLKYGIYSAVCVLVNIIMFISSIIPVNGSDIYITLRECGLINSESD